MSEVAAPSPAAGIEVEHHPLLDVAAFVTRFPRPLGELPSPPSLLALFAEGAIAPLAASDEVRAAVRDLLRHGGFRPTGRSKPASEYLRKAVGEGWISPAQGINLAVDAGNAVSLHSGLPISVIDAGLAQPPWRVAVCAPGTRYPFNPAGQVIDVSGLVCLHDAEGPCGSPVKDSQRTKTHPDTTATLTVIWGTRALPDRTGAVLQWYRDLLAEVGVRTQPCELRATA